MNTVNPWLDVDEVRRMATRLMKPAGAPPTNPADAGFDDGFVGFASGRPDSVAPSPSLPVEPMLQQIAPVTSGEPVAGGPLNQHLRHFCDWMAREFKSTGLFILDGEGAVVFDESSLSRLYFLARSLAKAPRRAGSQPSHVHVKIGAGTILEVIPVETPNSTLVLGVLVPQALTLDAVNSVAVALAQATAPRMH